MTPDPWLADRIRNAMWNAPGSPERDQIVDLISGAPRLRLTPAVAAAAAATVDSACGTLELCAGAIVLEDEALWVEYGQSDRAPAGTAVEARTVGALVCRDPVDPCHAAIFVAWTRGGDVFHSYALLHWDLRAIAGLARGPGAGGREARARLMEMAVVSVPANLRAELEIWQEIQPGSPRFDAAIRQTLMDVSGEHLFLLSALLLCSTPSVSLLDLPGEVEGPPRMEAVLGLPGPAMPWSSRGFRVSGDRVLWRPPLTAG